MIIKTHEKGNMQHSIWPKNHAHHYVIPRVVDNYGEPQETGKIVTFFATN